MGNFKENSAAYVTLDYIVQEFLMLRGDQVNSNVAKYYQTALRGFKELSYDVFGSLKTCVLDMQSETSSIDFPCDYVNYNRIGVLKDGAVFWLGYNKDQLITRCNKKINAITDKYPYNITNFIDFSNSVDPFVTSMFYDGGIYNARGGNNDKGYYNVLREQGRIAFTSEVNGQILLEYISDGVEDPSEVFVHTWMIEPIKAWLNWQTVQFKVNISAGIKNDLKAEFKSQKSHLHKRQQARTKEEWYQALRNDNTAALKF